MSQPAPLPKILGTQIGLRDPDQVDRIKEDMRNGSFVYAEQDNRIAGLRDPKGVYYVKDGHHRMVAAQELFRETRDAIWVLKLIH